MIVSCHVLRLLGLFVALSPPAAVQDEGLAEAYRAIEQGLEQVARFRDQNHDLEGARKWAEHIARIGERGLPLGDPARVRSWITLGEIRARQEEYGPALDAFERAADEALRQPEANAQQRIEALLMVAYVRAQIGEGAEAAAAELVAEATRTLPPGDPMVQNARRFVVLRIWDPMLTRAWTLATAAEGADLKAAERQLQGDLDRFRSALLDADPGSPLAPWGALWMAKFLYDRQQFAEAEEALDGLEAVARAALPARTGEPTAVDPLLPAEFYITRSLVATELGSFDYARRLLDWLHDREFMRQPELIHQRVRAQNALGGLLLRLGDYRAARRALQETVEQCALIAELASDPTRPYALTNLAKTFEREGDLDEATRLHREALDLARAGEAQASAVCLCLNNLGVCRYTAGALAEARNHFEEAREIAVRLYGPRHLHVAEIDVNLGWVDVAQGRAGEAEGRFLDALEIVREGYGAAHPRHAEVLGYLARLLARDGRDDEARARLEEAIGLRETALDRAFRSALSEVDRLALVQESRIHPESPTWPGVLDLYLELGPELEIPAERQYERLLAWKGAIARHAPPRVGDLEDDPEVQRLAREYEQVVRSLRDAAHAGPDRQRPGSGEDLTALEEHASALERRLRDRSPRFRLGHDREPGAPGFEAVRAAVPAGAALVDVIEVRYQNDPEEGRPARLVRRYVSFLIRPEGPAVRVDLGDADALDLAIARLLRSLEARDDSFAGPTAELAGRIRTPLLPHLKGVETLILAGDGLLHRLPMGVLPGSRPRSFWVEEMAFATVPSAHSLVTRRRPEEAPRPDNTGALIVGGVAYGPLAGRFPELKATQDEAQAIAGMYRDQHPREPLDLLTGTAATEPALRALLPSKRFVHLATHGFSGAEGNQAASFQALGLLAWLDTALVLARADPARDDPDDDQLLTAEEVGKLDLRGVDLIVLSACSSGIGHISAGQGVIGLIGALDRAGARDVVCSLWKVDDAATAALMTAFYRHLWVEGRGPARALQAAQCDLIRGRAEGRGPDRDHGAGGDPPPFSHPFHWAAFILSGDPGAPGSGGSASR